MKFEEDHSASVPPFRIVAGNQSVQIAPAAAEAASRSREPLAEAAGRPAAQPQPRAAADAASRGREPDCEPRAERAGELRAGGAARRRRE